MKMKKLLTMLVLLTIACGAKAEDIQGALSADPNPVSITPGDANGVPVKINMSNMTAFTAYQFNLVLPEGITLSKAQQNKNCYPLVDDPDEGEITTHSLQRNTQGDGSIQFVCVSTQTNDPFLDKNPIVTLTFKADANVTGKLTVTLKEIRLSTPGNVSVQAADLKITLDAGGSEPEPTVTIEGDACSISGDITTIPTNLFEGKDLTNVGSVDFSGCTNLNGVVVDRTAAPFNALSENVLIYMPAGTSAANTAAAGSKNVIISGVCDNLVLPVDKALSGNTDFTATALQYARSFTADVTCTIFLPITIPATIASQLGKFYTFAGINGANAVLNEVTGDIEANKPYIFTPKTSVPTIAYPSMLGAAAAAAPALEVKISGFKSGKTNGELIGTTVRKEFTASDDDIYGFASKTTDDKNNSFTLGQFVKAGAGAYCDPYHAYLKVATISPANIRTVYDAIVVDDATAINGISKVAEDAAWYNLNGQRLNAPTKKGLYIKNGKKMIIR